MAGKAIDDENALEDMEVFGDINDESLTSIEARLAPHERISLIAGLDIDKVPGITKDEGTKLLVVTNHRLLAYSSQDIRLLGEKSTFSDISIHNIKDMDVEEHKGFDRITIRTDSGEKTFMTPDKIGVKITGKIRELQEHGDPIDDLERLSRQHEEGHLTDEEYQSKKDELLDRV